jgi:hypothetical protein
MRFDHSLTAGGKVSGSRKRVRVRNYAKRWQTMVLAGTCQLKNKSLLANIDLVNRSNPYLFTNTPLSGNSACGAYRYAEQASGSPVDGFKFPV